MILTSIFITSGPTPPLPPLVAANLASFRACHPGFEHRLYNAPMLRDVLGREFGAEVLATFDALRPFAYQADLARYCLLFHHGGVYADLSYRFVQPCLPEAERLTVFRDFPNSAPWDVSTGLIAAPAGHKALALAIEMVCANVRNRYYGSNPLCPTGPTLFGKALALGCEPAQILVGGEAQWRKPRPWQPVRHCLCRGGEIVAVKRKVGGASMTELGITTGNDYNPLWHAGQIYQ